MADHMTEPLPSGGKGGLHYQVEVQGMEGLLRRIPGTARRRQVAVDILKRLTLAVEGKARLGVRRRSGATQRSITSEVNAALLVGMVGTLSKVGRFLEGGTGLFGPLNHRIFPLHASHLAWPIGASGIGNERLDMGLVADVHAGSGGVIHATRKTLRLTGQHTAGHARSGNAQMAYVRSIAGMHKAPFFLPAWEAALPLVPIVMAEYSRLLFEPTIASEFVA
jgi:hypothetical protein